MNFLTIKEKDGIVIVTLPEKTFVVSKFYLDAVRNGSLIAQIGLTTIVKDRKTGEIFECFQEDYACFNKLDLLNPEKYWSEDLEKLMKRARARLK